MALSKSGPLFPCLLKKKKNRKVMLALHPGLELGSKGVFNTSYEKGFKTMHIF